MIRSRPPAALRALLLWALLAGPARAEEVGVSPVAAAEPPPAATLTVVVAGVAEAKGQLLVSVFTSKAGWPKAAQAAATRAVAAEAPETALRIDGLPPGPVAVLVVHDSDGNGKLTMAWLPLPHPGEPVGASNGAKGSLGSPSFDEARIALQPGGTTARVVLD